MGRPKAPDGMFAKIPKVIAKDGRAAGAEALRDLVFNNWEVLKGHMNPYSAIKLALEADRHAMFAEVAELRKQGRMADELAGELSDYLKGKIDAAPDATGERVTIGSAGGFGSGGSSSGNDLSGIDDLLTEGGIAANDEEEE